MYTLQCARAAQITVETVGHEEITVKGWVQALAEKQNYTIAKFPVRPSERAWPALSFWCLYGLPTAMYGGMPTRGS
jgi:hypothetical protein